MLVPNARARSACTAATASPSRNDSEAKSPPTSSARRSPSLIRSRTLEVAIAQPSALLAKNSVSSAEGGLLAVDRPDELAHRPAAMCVEPTACSARWISASGFGPGSNRRNIFRMAECP